MRRLITVALLVLCGYCHAQDTTASITRYWASIAGDTSLNFKPMVTSLESLFQAGGYTQPDTGTVGVDEQNEVLFYTINLIWYF